MAVLCVRTAALLALLSPACVGSEPETCPDQTCASTPASESAAPLQQHVARENVLIQLNLGSTINRSWHDADAKATDSAEVGPGTHRGQSFGQVARDRPPYVNYYNGSNPLNIQASQRRSDNYFLMIGDWGRAGGPGSCQLAVAEKMKQYVREQAQAGKRILAVVSAGDNFYWSGATPQSWGTSWAPVYGATDPSSPLYGVPWLVTLGNHDLGDDDPYAFCPDVRPLATINGQAYASRHLNSDRNPSRPQGTELYWIPDYSFHYEIPGADLEFVFVDTNLEYTSRKLYSAGFQNARSQCGGESGVKDFLWSIAESGKELLKERARRGTARTTVIVQHYPQHGQAVKDLFDETAREVGRLSSVLSAWGHDHDQACVGRDASGNCNMVLTGGGGGCCMGEYGGFTAVHLTDDGAFVADVESERVRLPRHSCKV